MEKGGSPKLGRSCSWWQPPAQVPEPGQELGGAGRKWGAAAQAGAMAHEGEGAVALELGLPEPRQELREVAAPSLGAP